MLIVWLSGPARAAMVERLELRGVWCVVWWKGSNIPVVVEVKVVDGCGEVEQGLAGLWST